MTWICRSVHVGKVAGKAVIITYTETVLVGALLLREIPVDNTAAFTKHVCDRPLCCFDSIILGSQQVLYLMHVVPVDVRHVYLYFMYPVPQC